MNRHTVIALTAAAMALACCSRLPIYSHYVAMSDEGWRSTDTVRFAIPVSDSASRHVTLGLRTTTLFPYTQLTLVARLQARRSHLDITDTVTLDITDHQGRLSGQGISIFQHTVPLPTAVVNRGDTLRISIHHAMYRELMPGITDVGITVE